MLWEQIQHQLDKKNWTVYRLTKEAELSQNLLYELKNGRTIDLSFSSVCKIADALQVSLDDLRGAGEDTKTIREGINNVSNNDN